MGKRSRQEKKGSLRKESNRMDAARVSVAFNRSGFWVLVFVLIVGVTQIGSLEREVIDWDESIFILMAANVLDGHLPYVELFDNKPPLLFFMLAGVMAVFGESLLVVRLFGDVCILASCAAVFAIARRWTDPVSAGLGTLTFIAVSSAYAFSQHTSTELPATALLMAALWLLLSRRDQLWAVACAGLLVSLATLTRSNLGIVAVAFAGWLLVAHVRPSFGAHRRAFAAFVGAGAIPPGLLILLYWAADALFELRVSLIDVPFAYASNQLSVLEALAKHTDWWWMATQSDPYLIGTWTVLTAGVMTWASVRVLRERGGGGGTARSGASDGLLWLTFAAVLLSIMMSGAAYLHYWSQLFPLYGVFCARAFGQTHSRIALRRLGYALVLVCVASALWNTVPSAARLIADPDHVSKAHYIRHAARLITEDRQQDDTVWAFYDLPILWYLNEKPISKIPLPTMLLDKNSIMMSLIRSGYIAPNEFSRIMDTRPTYLVIGTENTLFYSIMAERSNDPTVRKDVEAIFKFINDHYSVFHEGGLLRVYKLRSKGDPTR